MVANLYIFTPYINRASQSIYGIVNLITFVATTVESEDHLSASAKVISGLVDMMIPLYKADTQTNIYTKTFTEIKEASEKLSKTALNSKKARIEKAEAAKRREEERLARKAALEEKRRLAAERAANRKPVKPAATKESLMQLLNLEASVVKARIQLNLQTKVVELLNAEQ